MDIGKESSGQGQSSTFHSSASSLEDVRFDESHRAASSSGSGAPQSPTRSPGRSPHRSPKRHVSAQNLHDQLPDIEEYKTSQQTRRSTSRINTKVTLAIAATIVVASILIAIGVVIGRDTAPSRTNSDVIDDAGMVVIDDPVPPPLMPSSGTTDNSNTALSEREGNVATLIANMGWTDAGTLANEETPQCQAARWLANDDALKLPVAVTASFLNRYVLATLYFALGGDEWKYELQFLTDKDVCSWNDLFDAGTGVKVKVGVACRENGALHELFFPNIGLTGVIPPELGLLYDLEDINLFGNDLAGELPSTMENLVNLETLILHNNRFNSAFPSWIVRLTNLRTLNLADNEFSGPLPVGLGRALPNLKTLSLESNDFTGDLSPLKDLTNIDGLYIGNNTFTGPLEDEVFDSWERIAILDASDNLLSGNLPAMLLASRTLIVVDLHGNDIDGALPSMVEVDSSIEFLALHDNKLTGSLQPSLRGLNKLRHLDLSANDFSGEMPSFLGEIKTLKYLFLSFNERFIASTIPIEYTTLTNLVDLSLQETNRIGAFPYAFESMHQHLTLLDLNSNKLTGTLPTQIGRMTALKFLLLQNTDMHGSIPAQLTHLTNLDTFVFDGTTFSGGSEHICSTERFDLVTVVGTCGTTFPCECCKCCTAEDPSCGEIKWFSGLDPMAEGGYVRQDYLFHEDDIAYPLPAQTASYYANYSGYYNTFNTYNGTTP